MPIPQSGPKNCCACGKPLPPDVSYFDRECWGILPGNERAAFSAMFVKRLDLTSKIAKCVRIIRARQAKAPTKS